jgi:two-component system C4-dicarboxylate transport response regulator DctD
MPTPHILVVDDHADTLMLYATALSLDGFVVRTASDAHNALNLLGREFDGVVTDLAMPGMSGAEFIRQVRSRGTPAIPIIVVTGQGDAQADSQLMAIGSCGVLRKPCDLTTLSQLLRHLTDICVGACERCEVRSQRVGC